MTKVSIMHFFPSLNVLSSLCYKKCFISQGMWPNVKEIYFFVTRCHLWWQKINPCWCILHCYWHQVKTSCQTDWQKFQNIISNNLSLLSISHKTQGLIFPVFASKHSNWVFLPFFSFRIKSSFCKVKKGKCLM